MFDGESALRSKNAQREIRQQCGLKIHAEPHYKRNMAERAVKEVKLRLAIVMDLDNVSLNKWKNYLDRVVTLINIHHETKYKTTTQMLKAYFTQPTISMPQKHASMYRFNINDKVFIDATPAQRKSLSFKYSLNYGN